MPVHGRNETYEGTPQANRRLEMILIDIYLFNSAVTDEERENEILGFEKNKISSAKKVKTETLYLDENHIDAFWRDPDIDDDTGNNDIIIYINGSSFRTPFRDDLFDHLVKVLLKRTAENKDFREIRK